MFIRLDSQGVVSIIEDGEATYQASAADFAADAADVVLAIPPGCRLVTFETESGVCTGYDAKGNAFPGIEWPNASDLHSRVAVLKQAHAARIAATEPEAIKLVRPKEVVPDTEDIATKTEVTVL